MSIHDVVVGWSKPATSSRAARRVTSTNGCMNGRRVSLVVVWPQLTCVTSVLLIFTCCVSLAEQLETTRPSWKPDNRGRRTQRQLFKSASVSGQWTTDITLLWHRELSHTRSFEHIPIWRCLIVTEQAFASEVLENTKVEIQISNSHTVNIVGGGHFAQPDSPQTRQWRR